MDRKMFVKYNVITEEEDAYIDRQSNEIKQYSEAISKTLQEEYQLYYEICSEVLSKEKEQIEAIRSKVQSKEFQDIYFNKRFAGKVQQILEEISNTEYQVLASIKKLRKLYKKILELENVYYREKEIFIEEIKKSLEEGEWVKYKDYFYDNRLFNKLCNADLIKPEFSMTGDFL